MNENTALEVSTPTILSVESLNRQIRQLIEGELGLVWVQGEISNFKAHTSGHFYFSLKDAKSQVSAVMFRGFNSRLRFKPTDGLEVIVRGRVSVYEPRGSYQIVCEMMEPVGAGALQKAFEQLKEKLKKEGLFESARKRPLPSMPRHIAIVTSPTGAAIRDMLNVLSRRNRGVPVTLIPTLVQGEGSAAQITEALRKAALLPNVDVIIIGRGGGSIEDLWAFNDEVLARAIAACPVPVISAVGHEIDFTIADFVADLRAPTPSAAAELVVKNIGDLNLRIEAWQKAMTVAMQRQLRLDQQKLQNFSARLVDPKRRLQDLILRNDELSSRLMQAQAHDFTRRRLQLKANRDSLTPPSQLIAQKRAEIDMAYVRMKNVVTCSVDAKKQDLTRFMSLLESLSPLKVVERGYSVVTSAAEPGEKTRTKKLIKSTDQVRVGDEISVRLMKGELTAVVKDLKPESSTKQI